MGKTYLAGSIPKCKSGLKLKSVFYREVMAWTNWKETSGCHIQCTYATTSYSVRFIVAIKLLLGDFMTIFAEPPNLCPSVWMVASTYFSVNVSYTYIHKGGPKFFEATCLARHSNQNGSASVLLAWKPENLELFTLEKWKLKIMACPS